MPDDPSSQDGAASYSGSVFVSIAGDGTVVTVATRGAADVIVYSTDAGTTSVVLPGVGQVNDSQLFPGALLVLLTAPDLEHVTASRIVDGAVTGTATLFALYEGIEPEQAYAFRLLSFEDDTVRASFATGLPPLTMAGANIGAFALQAPPGSSSAVDAFAQFPFAVPTGGAAVDTPQGTWISASGTTFSITGVGGDVTSILFAGADGSVVGPQSCDASLGNTFDLVAAGDQAALGLSSPSAGGLELYELSTEGGGSCTPLNALPSSGAYTPGQGRFYAEDGGFTLVTAGSLPVPFPDIGTAPAVGIARVSADAAIDTAVGPGGYTFYALPAGSSVGRAALAGDTLYVPVALGYPSTRVGLLRFKRTPEAP